MVLVDVEGVDVEFPFTPYECQTKYMSQVIKALTLKCDAALESPTGTGKTLSLLCASLAWLQREKLTFAPTLQTAMALANREIEHPASLLPKIYYCSRTHSQLAQVVRELNKTVYKGLKTTVLGSRDQLCINEKVSKEENNRVKSMMCRSMVSKHTCHYYNKWNTCNSDSLKEIYGNSGNVLDIEDLVNIAKKHSHCPYFQTKSTKETAELFLLPYNYLISPELRKIHEIDLKGSVVIFDEAHNLESICEECTSVELSSTDIAMSIKELQKAIETMQEDTELIRAQLDATTETFGKPKEKKEEMAFEIGTAAVVLQMVFQLEKTMEEYYKDEQKKGRIHREIPGKVFPGAVLLELFEAAQFTFDKVSEVTTLLRKAADYLHDKAELQGSKLNDNKGYLYKLEAFLTTAFTSHPVYDVKTNPLVKQMTYDQRKSANAVRDFRLYMYKEKDKDSGEEGSKIVMKYWCFSAGIAMQSLKQRGVRSVIVTSGTLSPLGEFMKNIGLDFGCTLENGHAANAAKQVICGVVKKAEAQNVLHELNGNYHNRKNVDYFIAIANCLKDLSVKVPQGVLVFFASYGLMDVTVQTMKEKRKLSSSIWEEISLRKPIVVEPRQKRELHNARMEFNHAIRMKGGAMFLAVCRGKVSEGIDFADADSRAVAIVGLPYPPLMDPRVMLKKMYLNEKREQDKQGQSGETWYRMEAFRAVNQAIGRVLRHVDDFGIVALLDARYSTTPHAVFSSWLRPTIKPFDNMMEFGKAADRFFGERGVEIQKSEEKMKLMTSQTVARSAKRRVVEEKPGENYLAQCLTGGCEGGVRAEESTTEAVDTLAALGEEQVAVPPKRPEKVVVPVTFGVVENPDRVQPPARKKIRLARPAPLGAQPSSSDNRKAVAAAAAAPGKAGGTSQAGPEADVCIVIERENVFPPEIQKILNLDDTEVKSMLRSLEKETFKQVAGVLKASNKGLPFETAFAKFKGVLLPNNPREFIAISKFFPVDNRKKVVEECLPYM